MEPQPSWLERLADEQAKGAAHNKSDPWKLRLERVRGKIDFADQLERISSQQLFDLLEVPQRGRGAGGGRRLAKLMSELGWTAVRIRGPSRGGFRDLVRGYARHPHSSLSGS